MIRLQARHTNIHSCSCTTGNVGENNGGPASQISMPARQTSWLVAMLLRTMLKHGIFKNTSYKLPLNLVTAQSVLGICFMATFTLLLKMHIFHFGENWAAPKHWCLQAITVLSLETNLLNAYRKTFLLFQAPLYTTAIATEWLHPARTHLGVVGGFLVLLRCCIQAGAHTPCVA